jgi:N-acetylmuramoyl-L-alanine amidase
MVGESVAEDAQENIESKQEIGKDGTKKLVKAEIENKKSGPNKKLGLLFKVQLATTANKVKTVPENFNGLEGVEYYEAGGLFRYTYGSEKTWKEANLLQQKVKDNGYDDSFVVAFHNGKRIAVGEAVKLLRTDK